MKRFVKISLGCIVLWYGALLFLMPSVSCGPTSGFTRAAQSSLKSHFLSAKMGRESFGDLESLFLKRLFSATSRGNRYYAVVVCDPSDKPIGVLAYPKYARTYQHNLVYRVAFLDGTKSSFPTYSLREDGLFCSIRTGIDSRNPPSKELFVAEGEPPHAAWCHDLNELLRPPSKKKETKSASAGNSIRP